MKQIRLGIAGCGIATRKLHLPALRELQDLFCVTALYNRTQTKAEALAETITSSPKIYNDFEKMLYSGEIDAVDISLAPELNFEFISKSIAAGIDVICEKPISINTAEGKKIVELAEGSDKVVYIAENLRHAARFKRASEVLQSGAVGQPCFATWQSWVNMSRSNEYVSTPWRKDPSHVGGYLSDGGVHHIAAIRTLVGDIDSVSAFAQMRSDYLGAEDTMACIMTTKSSSLVSYSVSYALHPCETVVKVIGPDGCILIGDSAVTVMKGEHEESYSVPPENTYKKEFADFYETLLGAKNLLGSPRSALKDLAVIEASLLSSKTGRTVPIDSLL
ncbi:MAG TPA: gfo/Idh/MocA family oxidoreductase [Kosmotogaceae bacterium]|nr:MAG: Oxidoreductase domain protein [Thermotogales bacterium 46_20]HAA85257.1 gfo/Idh/MocA family oxidoreductase [Kosmotogaceae bacterium]